MPEATISNRTLLAIVPVVNGLATATKLPIRLKWAAIQAAKKLDPVLKDLGEQEAALIGQYAVKDENGQLVPSKDKDGKDVPNTWVFKDPTPDTTAAFQKAHLELFGAETTLSFDAVPLELFEESDLNGAQLDLISFLIKP